MLATRVHSSRNEWIKDPKGVGEYPAFGVDCLKLAHAAGPGRRRQRRPGSRCSIGQSEVEIHSGELPAALGWQSGAHFSQFSTRSSGRASKSRSEVRTVAFIDRASATRSMST